MQSSSRLRDSLRTIVKSLGHGASGSNHARYFASAPERNENASGVVRRIDSRRHRKSPRALLGDKPQDSSEKAPGGKSELPLHAEIEDVPLSTIPKFEPGIGPDGHVLPEYQHAVIQRDNKSKLAKANIARIHRERHAGKSFGRRSAIQRLLTGKIARGDYVCSTETLRPSVGQGFQFKSNANEAILEILLRTGCTVQVGTPCTADGHPIPRTFASLHLWGLHTQKWEAAQLLQGMVEQVPCDEVPRDPENTTASVVRRVWTVPQARSSDLREALIYRPHRWNPITFAQYVHALTIDSRWFSRRQSGNAPTGVNVIIEELHSIVTNQPDLAHCVTSEAVDNMLAFMLKHSRMPDLKLLFNALESSPVYSPTASNYDVFLEHAATRRDVYNFEKLLHTMLEKGLQPTWRTWTSLHRLACNISNPSLVEKVVPAMRKQGVLDNPQAIKQVAANAIRHDIRVHYQNKGDLSSFLQECDRKFKWSSPAVISAKGGFNLQRVWMSAEAISFGMEELVKMGEHMDAVRLAASYVKHTPRMLHVRMANSLLTAACLARDTAAAVSVITRFQYEPGEKRSSKKQTAEFFSMLLNLAWETCSLNVLRVVWRYGCLRSKLPFSDYWMMRQSLTHTSVSEANEVWLAGDELAKSVPPERAASESEQLSAELDSILGDSKKAKKASLADPAGVISYEAEFFKRFAGKFATGISHQADGERRTTKKSDITPHEQLMIEYASTPRWLTEAERQQWIEQGKIVSKEDQLAWEQFYAAEPFHVKLKEAWRLDKVWKWHADVSFGPFALPSREELEKLDPVHRRSRVFDGLTALCTWMMRRGVQVPVKGKREQLRWRPGMQKFDQGSDD